MVRRIINCDL